MDPLTPLALIIVMVTAPIHYALEYPYIAFGVAVWAATVIIGVMRWRARLRTERKALKRAKKIALIREAIRPEPRSH